MTETTIETEILKKAESLNLEIYSLCCKLDRYKDKLSEPLYKYMAERLYVLYKEEFDRLAAPYFLERSREKFQEQERRDTLEPRRWRPWYFLWLKIRENRAAKLIVKQIGKETDAFFAACEKQLSASPETRNPPKTGISQRGQACGSTPGASVLSRQAAPTQKEEKA